MKRHKTGHSAPECTGADQESVALVRSAVADALAQLSAEHAAVIRCSYYLGWTTTRIAAELHIAESTVKSRLHFALRALRNSLQGPPTRSGHSRCNDSHRPQQDVNTEPAARHACQYRP
jgi:DNA-directed RNA polymerase specialized sigma24 family protein